MHTLSVFRPAHPKFYTIISDPIISSSVENSEQKTKKSREWNDMTTMYVMLQYKRWQMKDRKVVSLHNFHQQCVENILLDLGVSKTPTQIRDKVNNTRSSYHGILKQIQKGNFQWTQEKHLSLSKNVFNFMSVFFENKNAVSLDEIDKKINEIVKLHASQ